VRSNYAYSEYWKIVEKVREHTQNESIDLCGESLDETDWRTTMAEREQDLEAECAIFCHGDRHDSDASHHDEDSSELLLLQLHS